MRRVRSFAGVIATVWLAAACASPPATPTAHRVIATPEPTGRAEVSVETAPPSTAPPKTPSRTATRVAAPARDGGAPAAGVVPKLPAPAPGAGVDAFRKLGSWIDVFDHTDDPGTVLPLVRGMADRGTKTLYLESARYSSKGDFEFPKAMGAALDEAKSLGMRVVAWYPPDFKDLDADVRRSVAAVKYRSPGGNRFDAFAADIEYTAGVPDHDERNERTIAYSKRLRAAAGASYPLAAIVIPPTSLEINPGRWENFPWSAVGASYDVVMPMNYWTARGKDPKTAADLTSRNTTESKRLTGLPVHNIGGLGENADEAQVAAYVKAAKGSGSIGGGLYDYRTTRSEVWDELRSLNG